MKPGAAAGDGGPAAPSLVHSETVRLTEHQQVQPKLPAQGDLLGEPDGDEGDGPPVPKYPLLRVAAHEGLAGTQGHRVNRKRVQCLMRTMGLRAIYRWPRTSKPGPGHKVYPYLLSGMEITQTKSGVGRRHHLHPHGQGFLIPGGHHGLVHAVRGGLASFQHLGC